MKVENYREFPREFENKVIPQNSRKFPFRNSRWPGWHYGKSGEAGEYTPNSTWLISSLLGTTRSTCSTCRASRDERVELCCFNIWRSPVQRCFNTQILFVSIKM